MFGFNWRPFNQAEEQTIVEAITQAEKQTSGEIRVHIDKYCKTDPLVKGRNQFIHLGMGNTALKNGVLIYVSMEDHQFSIVGDEGIDQVVEDDFWDSTRDKMRSEFVKGDIVGGICAGIKEAGEQLQRHFPYQSDDTDELPNNISYG